MDRHDFISAPFTKKAKPISTLTISHRPQSGLIPYGGVWTENEVIHLLKRTMFGAKKSDIDYFKNLTIEQAVDELVNDTSPMPDPPVKDYNPSTAATPDTNIAAGTTWVNDVNGDGTVWFLRTASFKKWWMGLMVNQGRSVREKMTLFWHNHFATETNDVSYSQYIYKHHELLRLQSLGNFKTLTRAVTIDPAMLIYLNGAKNRDGAPDENYARELQELFCCGKGPDSQYTEDDVRAAAKVLTGWRANPADNTGYFTLSRHDTSNKQFSAFYNNTVIQGRNTATAGDEELDDLLNMIFNTQEVAKYICRKIYRWFVYYEIDSTVEANIITPLADIFRNNNYEIKPVLLALLKSEHFFDPLSMGCQIKSPVDFAVSACREFNVVFPPSSNYVENYAFCNYLVYWTTLMQQNIGDPPDVSGWKSYYQAPQFYEIWINSDTLPKRTQFTDTISMVGYTYNGFKLMIDGVAFAASLSNPSDPNQLITDSVYYLYRTNLSSSSKNQIKTDILLAGQSSDYYWTNIWNTYIQNPGDITNANLVKTRLMNLYKYLMGLAEYQLA